MTSRTVRGLLLPAVLMLLGPGVRAQEVPAAIRAQLEASSKAMEKAALAGDFYKQIAYFTDDIVFDHPLEPAIRGKAAFRAGVERMREAGVKYQSLSTTMELLWACGTKVYERGTWGMTTTSKDRKQPVAAYGSYFEIWRETSPGTYKIEYLIFTLDFNPFDVGK